MKFNTRVKQKRADRVKVVRNEVKVKQIQENRFLDPRYRTTPRYTFLQHIRVAYRWALCNYDISKPDLDLMLHFYAVGTFKKSDFHNYIKLITIDGVNLFKRLSDNNWIVLWRESRYKQAAYYVLSDKAKRLCDMMHKICLEEVTIPENTRNNFMLGKESPKINGYYMNLIKQMNKKVREKKKEQG